MGAVDIWTTVAVVLVAAMVQSTTGFGFSLLAVPLLSLAVPTELAVVVAATLGTLTSTAQAIGEREHGDRPTIGRMLAGAAIGAPFGLLVLELASNRQLKFGLAAVIGAFLLINLRGITIERGSRSVDVGAGLVSGVLNTALSTNGPPLVMALHARHLAPPVFRGTISAVFAGTGLITLGLFLVSGRYDSDAGELLLVAVPTMVIGYALGARLRPHIDPPRFRQAVMVLLTVTAIITLVGALLAS
ncbi:MAG: sulfite exporter TauE/SafE family protein [Actinobacteria bacterium]|nr:sulfite exporter TauE/SafE family protein [Actinomycetota bacterium]